MPSEPTRESDPRTHVEHIKARLTETMTHLREDIGKVRDPKAQALFETTAEVLQGPVTSYEHDERKAPAWR
jgi:hypothetical protein